MYRDVYQWVEKPPVTGVAHRMTSLEGQGNSSGHSSTGRIFTFQPSLNKTETEQLTILLNSRLWKKAEILHVYREGGVNTVYMIINALCNFRPYSLANSFALS